jgi:hypothetical protein
VGIFFCNKIILKSLAVLSLQFSIVFANLYVNQKFKIFARSLWKIKLLKYVSISFLHIQILR